MKNEENVIPVGLGRFLQSKFGGTLAAPIQPNICGHTADSNAKLKSVPTRVSDDALVSAVFEYYRPMGCSIIQLEHPDKFCEVTGVGFKLLVSLSNFTDATCSEHSRILLSVTER